MCGEDQGHAANATFCGKGTSFRAAPRTEIPLARRRAVTGAETGLVWRGEGEGWKRHLKKSPSRVVFCVLLRGLRGGDRGWSCGCHKKLAVVLLVEGDGVGGLWVERGVSAGDESATDGYFSGETNKGASDPCGDKGSDCIGNVTWVDGIDSAEDDQDLASAM